MMFYEYKVVPAPKRGLKARGVKTTEARFANTLETVMNDMGADGWEYQRTDSLPCEERVGLTGKTTVFQNMLVFRRVLQDVADDAPEQQLIADAGPIIAAPAPVGPVDGNTADVRDTADAQFEDGAPDSQTDTQAKADKNEADKTARPTIFG